MCDGKDGHQQSPDSKASYDKLRVPADNLPLLLAAVLALSVRHDPLLGRKQSVAAIQLAYKDFCLFGIGDPCNAGLELFWRRRLILQGRSCFENRRKDIRDAR